MRSASIMFSGTRPAGSVPAWLLSALLLSIPAFYMVLSAQTAAYRLVGHGCYLLSAALMLMHLRERASRRKDKGMALATGMDILICAGFFAAALLFDIDQARLGWPPLLIFCVLVSLRLVSVLGVFLRPDRLLHILVIALIFLAASGGAFMLLEPRVLTYADGLWLAFLTGATLGYGDLMPVTSGGRILAVFIVFVGYALFSIFTACVSALLVGEDEKLIRRELHAETRLLRADIGALREELRQVLRSRDGIGAGADAGDGQGARRE